MFKEFPDVMTAKQAAKALGICDTSVYRLIREKALGSRRVGRKYLIPKLCLIDFINSARDTNSNL